MEYDSFDLSTLPRLDQSKLLNGTVVPRPIAWVSTTGSAGTNLAPFSYFNVVAVEPAMLMFSVSVPIGRRKGSEKDTVQNLRDVPEFVLHIVDRPLADAMNATSGEHPRGEDEFAVAGLTKLASSVVRPPRIAEAGIAMECRLDQTVLLGTVPYHMFIGEVLVLHARKGLINERHHVDPKAHIPISRLGGPGLYSSPTDQFVMKQPE